MSELINKNCEVCQFGAPLLTETELDELMPKIPEWKLVALNNINQLQRTFSFENFVAAMAFAQKVGDLAEEEGHHPALLVEWGKVNVSWWTHKIKGLHENDVIMAAKTDAVFTDNSQ